MLFFQLKFLLFLSCLLLIMSFLKKNAHRKILMLAASYLFYAYFDYRFLALLLASTMTDYWVGLALSKSQQSKERRLFLLISLTVNLSILGFFKYYNFFVGSFLTLFGVPEGNHYLLHIALPLGISYYTFQTLNYTIDVYRKNIDPCRNLLDYALFVGFFPPLLSGPIVRASKFLTQLHDKPWNGKNLSEGIRLFIIGLFLKVFMADRLALFVDEVFQSPSVFDLPTVWLAVITYTLQLYFDFAGYSNMAIGVAKMLGYDIGVNFNFPYLSKSIAEFWKRWHISLSSWIRDYIYIPLGGSRRGKARNYVNLVAVMLLCGLWHGASWTFVLWGGYHGAGLAIHRAWSNSRFEALPSLVGWVLTMLFVLVGWVLFRSSDLNHAFMILRQMFYPRPGVTWMFPFSIFAVLATAAVHVIEVHGRFNVHRLPQSAWYTPSLLFSMLWMVIIFHPKGFRPFIYLNF